MTATVVPLRPAGIDPEALGLPRAFLEARFCSGVGQYHSPDNKRDPRALETITGAGVVALMNHPQRVPKARARWSIFSDYPSRRAEDQRQHGRFFALWADLDRDPPALQDAADRLAANLAATVLAYTSASATASNPKARLVVPLATACPGHRVEACQRILNDRLEALGITPDRATERANQVCYLPNRGGFYAATAGEDLLALGGFDWAETFAAELAAHDRAETERREALERRQAESRAKMAQRQATGQASPIGGYNAAFPLPLVLEANGYTRHGDRWLSPLSESGAPGVTITKDGTRWHTAHESDRDAGLPEWGDAFDLFTFWEHDGDRDAALRAAGAMMTTEDGRTLTEFNQDRYREARQAEALDALEELGDPEDGEPGTPGAEDKRQRRAFEEISEEISSLSTETDAATVTRFAAEAAELPAVERDKLHTALANQTGVKLSVVREAAKEARQRLADDHLAYALKVVEAEGRDNLLSTAGAVWRWESSGVWARLGDRTVRQMVQRALPRWSRVIAKSTVDSVTDLLRTEVHIEGHRFDVGDPETINCRNGELVHTADGWRLEEHRREHYRTSQIPVAYDPEARAPRFERFLGEVFEGDPDADDKARAILEMVGYSLVAHCRFERFALLVGAGANGKSVLLRVLSALVGADRVAGVQPSKFGSPFQRGHLEGKLVNLVSETRMGEVIDDAALKAIVSGEASTVEHKNRDPFELRPYATCWFGTNHMPHTRDVSDGFFRRALVIEFNRQFRAEDGTADTTLAGKLETELPGILTLAVGAYGEALARGHMTTPASSRKAAARWRREADQAAQFVEEACTEEPDAATPIRELYAAYREWALASGHRNLFTANMLSRRLDALGFARRKGGGGVRVVAGLAVRENGDGFEVQH